MESDLVRLRNVLARRDAFGVDHDGYVVARVHTDVHFFYLKGLAKAPTTKIAGATKTRRNFRGALGVLAG